MKILVVLCLTIVSVLAEKKIEVLVCLCDNKSQAIAKVDAVIGNGTDSAGNFYGGCSSDLSPYFKKSKKWKLIETKTSKGNPILVTLNFRHHTGKVTLVVSPYRGLKMRTCLEHFLLKTREAGKDELGTFISHNGMMDNIITIPKAAAGGEKAVFYRAMEEESYQGIGKSALKAKTFSRISTSFASVSRACRAS
jgi:hypothetical protein